jgi:hypothetical protein
MTDSDGVAPESQSESSEGRRGSGRSVVARLRALPPELQTAGVAAAALVASLILPWYQKNVSAVVGGKLTTEAASLSAFAVFSFVEAAILLLALGVLYLVWARSNARAFHLPGGDGTVIMAAGAWALLLLVWRLFDKPDVAGTAGTAVTAVTVGIQWGIFVAFVAAGALTATGARVRAARTPEPPNPAAEDEGWQAPPRRNVPPQDRRPVDTRAVTEVLRDPPHWQGEPPEPPAPGRRGDPSQDPTRVQRSQDPADAETRALGRRDEDAPTDRLF